jgi:hypothetical protein
VKIHDLKNLSNITAVITLSDEAAVDRIGWSEDGQLLLIGTNAGSGVVYVSKLARLFAVYSNIVALLTSLSQLTVHLVKVCLFNLNILYIFRNFTKNYFLGIYY